MKLVLPIPPSTNNLYLNARRGRVIAPDYRQWKATAGKALTAAKVAPVHGNVDVSIQVPRNNRRDVDNYAKAVLDLLVSHRVIDDDRHIQALHIAKLDLEDKGTCNVVVRPAC
jgi:Holliday junction resolvase RusA-like endonuclease